MWRVLVIFSGEIRVSWPPFDSVRHRQEDKAEQMHEQTDKWDVSQIKSAHDLVADQQPLGVRGRLEE